MAHAINVTESHAKVSPASLAPLVAEIERDLARRMATLTLPQTMTDAIRYSVLGGGKRLRPVLTLLSVEVAGGRRRDALPAAAALELIHTFSLVHDDLPAMDDDHLRRGRPTLHVHAGEAMAILAGDCMLALAFQWIAEAPLPAATIAKLQREVGDATVKMIAGQVFDTLGGFPDGLPDAERLEIIHRNKTAALIRAACRMGGLAAEAAEPALTALSDYGDAVGMMFQIVDDLLDVTQTTEHLGKAAGKDRDAGKLTWPLVHGTEASRREVARLRKEAHDALSALGAAAGPLVELCDFMAVRTR